jgi:hypothetical protein
MSKAHPKGRKHAVELRHKMTPLVVEHGFCWIVSGRGEFPVELLTSERATLARQADYAIVSWIGQPGRKPRKNETHPLRFVRLASNHAPRAGVWAAAGWPIDDGTSLRRNAATDLTTPASRRTR